MLWKLGEAPSHRDILQVRIQEEMEERTEGGWELGGRIYFII